MVGVLVDVARAASTRDRSWNVAVSAASRVIEAIDREANPEDVLVGILGSPERALEWMEAALPKLRAKVRRTAILTEGESR